MLPKVHMEATVVKSNVKILGKFAGVRIQKI